MSGYGHIVVGTGSAGYVVAARLPENAGTGHCYWRRARTTLLWRTSTCPRHGRRSGARRSTGPTRQRRSRARETSRTTGRARCSADRAAQTRWSTCVASERLRQLGRFGCCRPGQRGRPAVLQEDGDGRGRPGVPGDERSDATQDSRRPKPALRGLPRRDEGARLPQHRRLQRRGARGGRWLARAHSSSPEGRGKTIPPRPVDGFHR